MHEVIKQLAKHKFIPVITIDNAKQAAPLASAILAGGLSVIEITFRTPAAAEAIKIISNEFPELLLGAGTVLTPEQADLAVSSGARFVLAPGFNPRVVGYCINSSIPIIPGVNNPTLIELAQERGLEVLKYFPAEASGGLDYLNAIAGPFPMIKFIATGGITKDNLAIYLANKKIYSCGGSWVASTELLTANNYQEIESRSREVCAIINAGGIDAVK